MDQNEGFFSLKGVVQNYSWGGFEYLPSLLGITGEERRAFAEYWMGAHPNLPSIVEEKNMPLNQLIDSDKNLYLGQAAQDFGSLPFLLKILDVRQMLSIQVHPDKASAIKGFEDEELQGIPVNAAHRNYKDRNHKPELMVALGDFYLLHGFKEKNTLKETLQRVPELQWLVPVFAGSDYRRLYETVMDLPQDKVNEILEPLIDRILPAYENQELSKSSADFWAARAFRDFCKNGQYDRGIFSIYLFNLVYLKKGEGIYQQAGLPHAYLEGQNVEVMANSDNVLRAGLTDKHIDIRELMKHVRFEETIPAIIHPWQAHTVYTSPAKEFELHHYNLKEGSQEFRSQSPEILLQMEGETEIIQGPKKLLLHPGRAVYIIPGISYHLATMAGSSLFRVVVPTVEN